MVDKLPDKIDLPPPGPQESIDEIPSPTEFYDGSKNLNVIKVNCRLYANPKECLNHSNCGWCGSSNSCILGNKAGPQQACVKNSYIYSAPYQNWDAHARIVSIDPSVANKLN